MIWQLWGSRENQDTADNLSLVVRFRVLPISRLRIQFCSLVGGHRSLFSPLLVECTTRVYATKYTRNY